MSKQFFQSAAKAFVGAQVWRTEGSNLDERPIDMGIVRQYCTVVEDWYCSGDIRTVLKLPSLKTLTLKLIHNMFDKLTRLGKYAWEHELDEKDFESLAEVQLLSKLRGLVNFHLEPYRCSFANTHAKEQIWRQNVEGLRNHIKMIVTKSRSGARALGDGPAPLYPGSRVTYNSSALLPDPGDCNFDGEHRFNSRQSEKVVISPNEVAARLGKTGAELWTYVVELERFQAAAIKSIIRGEESMQLQSP